MGTWLRYIGNAVVRVLTHANLSQLGADASILEKLGENKAIVFAKGVAQHVEADVANFIAGHPSLQGEFHQLSQDEIAAEQAQRTGNSDASSTPTTGSSNAESAPTGTSTPSSADQAAAPATPTEAPGTSTSTSSA